MILRVINIKIVCQNILKNRTTIKLVQLMLPRTNFFANKNKKVAIKAAEFSDHNSFAQGSDVPENLLQRIKLFC